jgi:hypothetical protein
MLRESTRTTVPEGAPEAKKPPNHEEIVEERLDLIVHYLQRADKRDRWRTWSSTARSIVSLLPFLLFLGSLWYVYAHGEDLLQKVADEAARSAARYSQQSAEGLLDKFKGYLPGSAQGSSSSRRN